MSVSYKPIDIHVGMISGENLSIALKAYGFNNSWTILPFIEINDEIVAMNRRSETARKAVVLYNKILYILKEIPWYCAKEKFIDFEIVFQNKLKLRKLPIPSIIKNVNGKYWIKIDKDFFYLQEYLIGKSWISSKQQAYQAGRTLGLIHQESKKLNIVNSEQFKESAFTLAKKMLRILEEFTIRNKKNITIADNRSLTLFIKNANKIIKGISRELVNLKYLNNLIPIHGDFNPWNIIFSNDGQVIGIIDFDNSGIDNPAHDIAESLLDFSFMKYKNQTTRFFQIPEVFNIEIGRELLSGYKKINDDVFAKYLTPIIPKVAVIIFLELSALGLLRGDFDLNKAGRLIKVSLGIENQVFQLLRKA